MYVGDLHGRMIPQVESGVAPKHRAGTSPSTHMCGTRANRNKQYLILSIQQRVESLRAIFEAFFLNTLPLVPALEQGSTITAGEPDLDRRRLLIASGKNGFMHMKS